MFLGPKTLFLTVFSLVMSSIATIFLPPQPQDAFDVDLQSLKLSPFYGLEESRPMFSFLSSWRPSEGKKQVVQKVKDGAHLTEGEGVKHYLGNTQIDVALFKKGLPLSDDETRAHW